VASNPKATAVAATSVTLKGLVNPGGAETKWRFGWGTSSCTEKPASCNFTGKGTLSSGTSPAGVEKPITGLAPATVYHFLLEAVNSDGKDGVEGLFATPGEPSKGLPDGRAYEQSSPADKNGDDAEGQFGLTKAAIDGNGISFFSSFGIPGGKDSQELPSYLALRGEGEAGWAAQGLLPPPVFGERALVEGWLPDFSKTYSEATRLGSPRVKALVEQSTDGGESRIVSPYTAKAEYSYAGASAAASVVLFESEAQLRTKETGGTLIEAAAAGFPNVYAWNRASGEVHLAGVLNDEKAPPRGTMAGPYAWSRGIEANTLKVGGAKLGYYLQGSRAFSESGDVYFTEVGTGQLYLRLNPTQPQSPMEGEKCLEPETKACTVHVSASHRTVLGPDPAGPQPAAFQAASADGLVAYFTSPEKLTDESNTGPEQPEAAIGTGTTASTIEDEALVNAHAIGVVATASHLYWAESAEGAIGRSGLNGSKLEKGFIAIPPGECEVEVEVAKEKFEVQKVEIPSTPRYVTVDTAEKYVYWTNSGLRDKNGRAIDGGGTIGRAELDGSGNLIESSIDPDFICGEVEPTPGVREKAVSNPQGIAVNSEHIYWANAATGDVLNRWLARADIDGGEVEAKFVAPPVTFTRLFSGVAIDGGHIYLGLEEPDSNDNSFVLRVTLAGTEPSEFYVGDAGIRGLALDATSIYWANQEERAIGTVPLADAKSGIGGCPAVPTCNSKLIQPVGSPVGLALEGSNLYWSVNGEAASNPGNDLYRFEASGGEGTLEDLTPEPEGDGAEAQGVLGASADGSRVYFAADADLDGAGPASEGDCHTPKPHGSIGQTTGSCSVYLWDEGTISYVGRVRGADAIDWTGTPREVFKGYAPKSAFVSADGRTLLFGSREKLSAYENEGVPELYRFHEGDAALSCVSCPPTGEAPGNGPSLGSIRFPGTISPLLAFMGMVESRNLSSDGKRAFFESAEALVGEDTNGQGICPGVGPLLTPACQDVYEWEAPSEGGCTPASPAYSSLNEGCLYLISTGKSTFPSFFADASQNGADVFFFTRQSLVGQDKDELQDVYDARVGGGLAVQNPASSAPCESADACHGPSSAPAAETSPATAGFLGPSNPKPKHKKPAAKHKKHKAKKHQREHGQKKHQRAGAERRAGR